jgi:hypothetical protein
MQNDIFVLHAGGWEGEINPPPHFFSFLGQAGSGPAHIIIILCIIYYNILYYIIYIYIYIYINSEKSLICF